MEQYTTFLLPQFVDFRMLFVWITAAAVVLFLFFFFLWKISPKAWYPKAAVTFTLIAIALLPVAYYGTPFYNTKLVADSVATDYGVSVSTATNYTDLIVAHSGEVYKCTVNSKDNVHYYVLCDISAGRVFLDDIVAGKYDEA